MLAKDLKIGDRVYRVCDQKLSVFEITKILIHSNNFIHFNCIAIIDPANLPEPYFEFDKDSEVYNHTDTFIFTANEQEAIEFLRKQIEYENNVI
jgi:hypothetical protein